MRQIVFKVGFLAIAAALIALVVADYLAYPWTNWSGAAREGPRGATLVVNNRTNALLYAVRVEPQGPEDGPVSADPGEQVDFVYRIENRTDAAVDGLKVEPPSCCFQIVRDLPASLPAGGAAEFGFRVRSPVVGTVSKHVPIFTSVPGAPAAVVLRASMHANAKAPRLLEVPEYVKLSAIRGDPLQAIVRIGSVELSGSSFVTGLVVAGDLAGAVVVEEPDVSEQVLLEGRALLRSYSFKLSVAQTDAIPRMAGGYITVRTRSVDGRDDRLVPLYATVLDDATVVPEEVVFDGLSPSSSETKRVIVVNRRPQEGDVVEIKRFDDTLLAVRQIGAATSGRAVFEVQAASVAASPAAAESRVVFAVGPKEIWLMVRFARATPSEGPAP
jgi:hypothetical protein